ncbi:serine hydrolase domain-containing protein [Roseateles sp.]
MPLHAPLLAAVTVFAALTACGGGSAAQGADARVQQAADNAVRSGLAGVVLGHLGASERLLSAAGVRQVGLPDAVKASDAFMIGSTTKAMTAALAGRLVERGAIAWSTTLAEALPDLAAGMRADYRRITLEQLLAHRGGLLAFNTDADFIRFQAYLQTARAPLPTTLAQRQRFFAAWLLAQEPPPNVTPGETFAYSNAGYALAALMLESRTGRPYAALMQQELTLPLGLSVTWTAADQRVSNGPVGHAGAQARLSAVPPEDADSAAWLEVLRPAGDGTTVSPDSYARWVRWHLRALRGEATPLASSYLQRLQALKAGDYALGWVAGEIDGRPVLFHDGENRGFSTLLVIDRQGRSASFGFTNTAADDGSWVIGLLNQALLTLQRAQPLAS